MATELLSLDEVDLTTSRRSLILVWQNPATRLFAKVGQIDALPQGRFAFHYFTEAADVAGFVPLDEFPNLDRAYVSDEVPAFFANRILSSERRGYDKYLNWLGVVDFNDADIPFEVLARTGAGRATDTFHIVDVPVSDSTTFTSRFFVSGIQYATSAERAVSEIHDGSPLVLKLDQTNPVNTKAVLIDTRDGSTVGFVPDWLCGDIHALITDGWNLNAVADRVNPDAPAHVRVLCRVEARRA